MILFKTLNDTTQTIPTSAIRLFSIMSLFLTPVFLPSRHQHPNLRFWFLFRIYHLFIMDFTVLTHLPPPLLEYAEKHIADVSTNAGHSLFRAHNAHGRNGLCLRYHQHRSETWCEMSQVFISATANDMIAPWRRCRKD